MASGLEVIINRPRPSTLQRFWRSPLVFLAQTIYHYCARRIPPAELPIDSVTVVCISDTHNYQPALPDGDILIHAGDLTQSGSFTELQATIAWLRRQPHPHKIVVVGNHDLLLDPSQDRSPDYAATREQLDWGDIIYLENSETVVTCANGRRLHVYGSPQSPKHGNWAFQYHRNHDAWTETVPSNTDILVTHGPPRAHLDLNLGCNYLLSELWRVRPRLHVCGHIHEGRGQEWLVFDQLQHDFETTIIGKGDVWNFLRVLAELLRWLLLTKLYSIRIKARTQLVNAAMVGGLRDEEKRVAIKLTI